MSLEIKEVKSKGDRKKFVDFQFELYKNNKFWVPPTKKDEIKAIDPDVNPAYSFCEARSWLVYKDNNVSGRVTAIINTKYNEKVGIDYGRVNRIEFIDDVAVFDLLINTCLNWFKE